MRPWLLDHVGLARPYRFGRLLVVLAALLLAIAAGVAVIWYRLIGELAFATPRFWYFLYVLGLLGLTLLGARRPRYAAVALSLATLELGLGVGSNLLERSGHAPDDLLPLDGAPLVAGSWHPLLQEVVQPGAVRRTSDGQIHYNSRGMRGPERSADELRGKTVVVLFGGSTTEDITVPDGRSWSDRLQQILGERFAVLNRGSAWYSSVQLALLTAFYDQVDGVTPQCAVYLIGGVDVQMSHIRNLDPGYADFQKLALVDAVAARRIDRIVPPISPTLRYLGRLLVLAFDTVRPASQPLGAASNEPDSNMEAIYHRNVRTISAINRERGIVTIWIGEVVHAATLAEAYAGNNTWAPYVPGSAVWPLLSRLNHVLQREASALGDVYIDVPVTEFTADDFVDGEHFSPRGAEKFAALVAPKVSQACRR